MHVMGTTLVLSLLGWIAWAGAQSPDEQTGREHEAALPREGYAEQTQVFVVEKLQAQVVRLRDERIMLQEQVAHLQREFTTQKQEQVSQEKENLRLRRRVGELQAKLAAYVLLEQQVGGVERLQQSYAQALRDKESLQQHVAQLQQQRTQEEPRATGVTPATESALAHMRQRVAHAEAALRGAEQRAEAAQAESARWDAHYHEQKKALREALRTGRRTPPQHTVAPQHDGLASALIYRREDLVDVSAIQSGLSWQPVYDQVRQRLGETLQHSDVKVYHDADRLTMQFGGDILFRSKVKLHAEGERLLNEVAQILQAFPGYRVTVAGHTDAVPIGTVSQRRWPTNWELSAARAAVIVRHFTLQGVAPERLVVIGHAWHQPIASNDTPEGRARNRRIDITVSPLGFATASGS
jgi:flagellar motor protein MotB